MNVRARFLWATSGHIDEVIIPRSGVQNTRTANTIAPGRSAIPGTLGTSHGMYENGLAPRRTIQGILKNEGPGLVYPVAQYSVDGVTWVAANMPGAPHPGAGGVARWANIPGGSSMTIEFVLPRGARYWRITTHAEEVCSGSFDMVDVREPHREVGVH